MASPDPQAPDEATDVVRPGTDAVRPGTDVVRPGTGVVRPGTGVAAPTEGPAKARAVVPDAAEQPLEPVHVVLPVIEVKPAKQGLLDRLVAGRPKKTQAAIAKEEATRAAEEQREAEAKARQKASGDDEETDDEDPDDEHDEPLGPTRAVTAALTAPPTRPPGPVWRWAAAVVAAVVLGTTGAALAGADPTPPQRARWVGGIDTGTPAALLAGLAPDARRPTSGGLAGVVGPLLADAGLGGRVTASIVDVASGESLFDLGGTAPATPASTTKLLTAAAVLHSRGPTYQIATRVVAGVNPGEVVLIGGGDPTLAAGPNATYRGAARMDVLADQVRGALGPVAPTRVLVDTSAYAGPAKGPGWDDVDLHAGVIAHPTALMTDGARTDPDDRDQTAARYWEPAVAAGQIFAGLLGLPPEAAGPGPAPAGARELGKVLSPPIGRLVETMLDQSDNVIAEALARQAALARNLPASFEGGAQATRDALAELGVSSDGLGLVDGSGLSNSDKVSAAQLTALLAVVASPRSPTLRSIVSGLPVAGYSGTLAARYSASNGAAGAGVVRAKTGTLTGVNALAGLVVDRDGRLLAFSLVADEVGPRPEDSQRALQALDRIAAAIAGCGC